MKFEWVVILVIIISVLIFVLSHFNETVFRLANYLFFMSFIISLYAFYINENRTLTKEYITIVTSILSQLADVEANPTPPQVILLVEKIKELDPSIAQPEHLGKRIQHVMVISNFPEFWKENKQYYDSELVSFITPLLPPSTTALPLCGNMHKYPVKIADGYYNATFTDKKQTGIYKQYRPEDRHIYDKIIRLAKDGLYSPILSTCIDEKGAEMVTVFLPIAGEDILDEKDQPRKGWETSWKEFTDRLRMWLAHDKNRRLTGVMEFHGDAIHAIQRFSFRGDDATHKIYIAEADFVVD